MALICIESEFNGINKKIYVASLSILSLQQFEKLPTECSVPCAEAGRE